MLILGANKFDTRSRKCIFFGFKNGVKGYVVLDTKSREIFISRDVIFHEETFVQLEDQNGRIDFEEHQSNLLYESGGEHINVQQEDIHTQMEENTLEDHDVRRSCRLRKAPVYLKDYHHQIHNSIISYNNTHVRYPISSVLPYNSLNKNQLCLIASVSSHAEPKLYEEAVKKEEWKNAMKNEIEALNINETWSITDLPLGKRSIGCKWVYKLKFNADGKIKCYKARLMAKGYTQVEGIDYHENFSPVAKITTIRLLIAVTAAKNWHLDQLDVNNAFVHGDLDEEVYMDLPQGLCTEKPNQVCRLKKSLYGLKQASRQWYSKLANCLHDVGFTQSSSDYSLFTRKTTSNFMALLVYVDDIILAGDDAEQISTVKEFLDRNFKIKDLGRLSFF